MIEKANWYELRPCDAWFFRDGRPMNRGEDADDMESLFPPYAPTVVGAFRAALARAKGWDGRSDWSPETKKILGDGFDDLGKLSFWGPLLARHGEVLYPFPQHLLGVVEKSTSGKSFEPLNWLRPSTEAVVCDVGSIHLPTPPSRKHGDHPLVSGEGFYLTHSGMQAVLDGKLPNRTDSIHRGSLFGLEPRVGIERNQETRTTGDGALFNPHFVRLGHGVSLLVGISGLPKDWTLPPLFPIGGESRLAQCEAVKPPQFPSASLNGTAGCAVLLSVTPTSFHSDNWFGPTPGQPAAKLHRDLKGEVQTVAMDRPSRIPGWDSLRGHPLPQRAFVAPGSIWWLEKIPTNISAGSLIEVGDRCSHGYGLALLARAPS